MSLAAPTNEQAGPPEGTLFSLDGPQLFAHYAFMPNRLTFCGGEDSRALFDYCVGGASDTGLVDLLKNFAGALPYLRLIARSNLIPDPFDLRVVEAYWIGNELLNGVESRQMYADLRERYSRHLDPRNLELVLGKAPQGARPHHSFHVIEVCPRNGWPQTLDFMDSCRISWGEVVEVQEGTLVAKGPRLQLQGNDLRLGEPEPLVVNRQIEGQGFVDEVQPGDWISIHWKWACQVLTRGQAASLEKWTRYHLTLANRTL
jgi:hypothetical protein